MNDFDPAFSDFETTIKAGGRGVPGRITDDALHAIWGADVGPHTPHAIFEENRPLFEDIVADRLLAGHVADGVVVSEADLDMKRKVRAWRSPAQPAYLVSPQNCP